MATATWTVPSNAPSPSASTELSQPPSPSATVSPGAPSPGQSGGPELPVRQLFSTNVGVRGGIAPVRAYLPELLEDVWAGSIEPGWVFDLTLPLAEVAEAYRAMDERRAVKVMLRP